MDSTASSIDYLIMIICGELDDTDEIYIVPEDETEYIFDDPISLDGGGSSSDPVMMNGQSVMTKIIYGQLYGSLQDMIYAIGGRCDKSTYYSISSDSNGRTLKTRSLLFSALSTTKAQKRNGGNYLEYEYKIHGNDAFYSMRTQGRKNGYELTNGTPMYEKFQRLRTKWREIDGKYYGFYVDIQAFCNYADNTGITPNIAMYTVTFITDGVSPPAPQTAFTVSLPSVSKSGYTFDGWYTAATGGTKVGNAGDYYIPTANITLYARWIANNDPLSNFENDAAYPTKYFLTSTKKAAMVSMGRVLAEDRYEPAFVAGMIANIQYEGEVGKFENSNYTSNPSAKPWYLTYMDNNYSYASEYSGQYIMTKNLSVVKNLLTTLQNANWPGGFGLGTIQWTWARTLTLVNIYLEVTNGINSINNDQATKAEGIMISRELSGTYKSIYSSWLTDNNGKLNSEDAAYDAGYKLCVNYEVPDDRYNKAITRGNSAKEIYKIMTST